MTSSLSDAGELSSFEVRLHWESPALACRWCGTEIPIYGSVQLSVLAGMGDAHRSACLGPPPPSAHPRGHDD